MQFSHWGRPDCLIIDWSDPFIEEGDILRDFHKCIASRAYGAKTPIQKKCEPWARHWLYTALSYIRYGWGPVNPLEKNAAWHESPKDITVHRECKVRSLILRIFTANVQLDLV